MRIILTFVCFAIASVVIQGPVLAEEDTLRATWLKAKGKYQDEIAKIRQLATDQFDAREKEARFQSNSKLLEHVKTERIAFAETKVFPKSLSTALKTRLSTSQKAYESQLEWLAKEYTKTGKDDRASEMVKELKITRLLAPSGGILLAPLAAWTFEKDEKDTIGGMHGELVEGAFVEKGRLKLDGKKSRMKASLSVSVSERTLEIWVQISTFPDHDLGVTKLISGKPHTWDGALLLPTREWYPGSSYRHRSKDLRAPLETDFGDGKLIHIAISYEADGHITMFRNGRPYGDRFHPGGEAHQRLQTYEKAVAILEVGGADVGTSFEGEVEELRLYTKSLSATQIEASFLRGVMK